MKRKSVNYILEFGFSASTALVLGIIFLVLCSESVTASVSSNKKLALFAEKALFPAVSSSAVATLSDDDDDDILTILSTYQRSISTGHADVKLSNWYVVYDASQDTDSSCTPFLDSPGYALSSDYISSTDDFDLQFAAQSSSGSNYWVRGRMNANGNITQAFKVDCAQSILGSPRDPVGADYAGSQWVNGAFQQSGTTYTLIHNEYYGGNFPTGLNFHIPATDQCNLGSANGTLISPFWCTYAAIGIASYSSSSGGAFTPEGGYPGYLVARPSFNYVPNGGGQGANGEWGAFSGYKTNTNLVERSDGYYYLMAGEGFPNGPSGSYNGRASETIYCPIRSNNLSDPTSWRAWDGDSYSVDTHSGGDCSGVIPNFYPFYLGYNTYLGRYILIGGTAASPQNKSNPAFAEGEISYALSDDLVHWIGPVGLDIPIWNNTPWKLPNDESGWDLNNGYASLIDPVALEAVQSANSSSGAVTGQHPILLMVQHSSVNGATRLVAIPITFSN